MNNWKNPVGKRFTKLTVLNESKRSKDNRVYWLCKCDCGNEKWVRISNLVSKNTQSCGCLSNEKGFITSYRTPLITIKDRTYTLKELCSTFNLNYDKYNVYKNRNGVEALNTRLQKELN